MDEKIEDLNHALKTYHTRFQRICNELNILTIEINKFLVGSACLPPEFHADFNPIFLRFSELYIELGECMEDIGNNSQEFFNWFNEYTSEQNKRIAILEYMIDTYELINEINEAIIKN